MCEKAVCMPLDFLPAASHCSPAGESTRVHFHDSAAIIGAKDVYRSVGLFFFFPDSERETGGSKALGLRQEAALQAEEEPAEGPCLTFFLGRRWLVWPYFLRQLTVRG